MSKNIRNLGTQLGFSQNHDNLLLLLILFR